MINDEEQRDHLPNKKLVIIYRALITFSILETLTVLILLSNEIRETLDILLNYSIWVWGVLILFFMISLLLGFLFAELYTKRTFIHEIYQKIIQIQERKFVGFLLVGIILMGLLLELYFLIPTTEYFQNNDQIMFLYKTLSPTIVTIILLILQVLGFTSWIKNLSWKEYWSDPNLRNLTFGFIILGFTFLYWGIMLI